MSKESILLISQDAGLRTWAATRVLQPAGFAYEEASNLATARATSREGASVVVSRQWNDRVEA